MLCREGKVPSVMIALVLQGGKPLLQFLEPVLLSSGTLCLPFWMTMPVEEKQEREKEEEGEGVEGEEEELGEEEEEEEEEEEVVVVVVEVEVVGGEEILLRHLLQILYQNHKRCGLGESASTLMWSPTTGELLSGSLR